MFSTRHLLNIRSIWLKNCKQELSIHLHPWSFTSGLDRHIDMTLAVYNVSSRGTTFLDRGSSFDVANSEPQGYHKHLSLRGVYVVCTTVDCLPPITDQEFAWLRTLAKNPRVTNVWFKQLRCSKNDGYNPCFSRSVIGRRQATLVSMYVFRCVYMCVNYLFGYIRKELFKPTRTTDFSHISDKIFRVDIV